jgi:glycosyltransferase involved in cell wall biosynthesis
MSLRAAFVSVVPSPYQRDLFRALAARPEVALDVFYMEAAAPDSPWPEKALAPHEYLLRGFWFPLGSRRCHVNWPLPAAHEYDVLVLNTLMSVTAQRLMRTIPRGKPWLFWGERLGRGGAVHRWLSAPLHEAAGIAAIGSAAQADYRERFPEPRSYNIPYHCDLSAFLDAPRPVRSDETVTFLFCGQMIARKGLDLLLRAFARLDARARLLLVGREADLPEMLAGLPAQVRERIEYAGFQAPEALPQFYARADVFVLPSRHEGWGVVVNQALGAGLPILCSDAVGAGFDLVEEGVNGSRVRADDAEALEAALRQVLERPEVIAAWGEASRAKAAAWSPEAGAAKWVAALQECAGGARG